MIGLRQTQPGEGEGADVGAVIEVGIIDKVSKPGGVAVPVSAEKDI